MSRAAANPTGELAEGRGVFQRHAAIGTSISMGWASEGVLAATMDFTEAMAGQITAKRAK